MKGVLAVQGKTDSYFLGEIEPSQVAKLEDRKIIFQVQEQFEKKSEFRTIDGLYRGSFLSNSNDKRSGIIEEQWAVGYPSYYFLQLQGPLLLENRMALSEFRIQISEITPANKILVKIPDYHAHQRIAKLDFVRDIIYFSSHDTFDLEKNNIPQEDGMDEAKIGLFDIWFHEHEQDFPLTQKIFHHWRALADQFGYENFPIARSLLNYLIDWPYFPFDRIGRSFRSNGKRARVLLPLNSIFLRTIASLGPIRHLALSESFVFSNDLARKIIGFDDDHQFPIFKEFKGEGQIIGVADSGIDDSHEDIKDQIHATIDHSGKGNYIDDNGHGTHVVGSIAGNGKASNGAILGTAPESKIFFQAIMDENGQLKMPHGLSALFQESFDPGARIHNNSWGAPTNSNYTINSLEVDEFAWHHPEMLLVFAAGNEGDGSNNVNAPTGYPEFKSVGSPATAKNVLTVGASRNIRLKGGYSVEEYGTIWPNRFPIAPIANDTISGNSQCLAAFSSRGPCNGHRIKPDIVAPGTDIASLKSKDAPLSNFWGIYPGNKQYAILGGTSMAAPLVSGCAAITREFFEKKHKHSPSAALVKATLINGSLLLSGPDSLIGHGALPNWNQGFGCANIFSSIPTEESKFDIFFIDTHRWSEYGFDAPGQGTKVSINLSKNAWLRICLAYTDAPGSGLQNNINIFLVKVDSNQKWIGNANRQTLLKEPDDTNNVEIIRLEEAESGQYELHIKATSIIKPRQQYALVVTSSENSSTITVI